MAYPITGTLSLSAQYIDTKNLIAAGATDKQIVSFFDSIFVERKKVDVRLGDGVYRNALHLLMLLLIAYWTGHLDAKNNGTYSVIDYELQPHAVLWQDHDIIIATPLEVEENSLRAKVHPDTKKIVEFVVFQKSSFKQLTYKTKDLGDIMQENEEKNEKDTENKNPTPVTPAGGTPATVPVSPSP